MIVQLYLISIAVFWIGIFVFWLRGEKFTYGELGMFLLFGILPFINTFFIVIYTVDTVSKFKIWGKQVPSIRKQ